MRGRRLVHGLACLLLAGVSAPAMDFREVKQRGSLRVLYVAEPQAARFFSLMIDRLGFDHELLLGFARLHQVQLEPIAVEGWELLAPALLAGHGDLVAGRLEPDCVDADTIVFTTAVLPTEPADADPDAARPPPSSTSETALPLARAVALEQAVSLRHRPADGRHARGDRTPTRGYGLRAQDTALLTALNDYLVNVRHTVTWSQLLVKYFADADEAERTQHE